MIEILTLSMRVHIQGVESFYAILEIYWYFINIEFPALLLILGSKI